MVDTSLLEKDGARSNDLPVMHQPQFSVKNITGKVEVFSLPKTVRRIVS